MLCSITVLPFEILVNVVSYLNLEDFVNLKCSKKELFEILNSERISRAAVKVCHDSIPWTLCRGRKISRILIKMV